MLAPEEAAEQARRRFRLRLRRLAPPPPARSAPGRSRSTAAGPARPARGHPGSPPSCPRSGSALSPVEGSLRRRRFLPLEERAAAPVARQRRRAEAEHDEAVALRARRRSAGGWRPVLLQQAVAVRRADEGDPAVTAGSAAGRDCVASTQSLRAARARLLLRRERHLVEQRDDALDQLGEPVERGQEHRRRLPPPAKQRRNQAMRGGPTRPGARARSPRAPDARATPAGTSSPQSTRRRRATVRPGAGRLRPERSVRGCDPSLALLS